MIPGPESAAIMPALQPRPKSPQPRNKIRPFEYRCFHWMSHISIEIDEACNAVTHADTRSSKTGATLADALTSSLPHLWTARTWTQSFCSAVQFDTARPGRQRLETFLGSRENHLIGDSHQEAHCFHA